MGPCWDLFSVEGWDKLGSSDLWARKTKLSYFSSNDDRSSTCKLQPFVITTGGHCTTHLLFLVSLVLSLHGLLVLNSSRHQQIFIPWEGQLLLMMELPRLEGMSLRWEEMLGSWQQQVKLPWNYPASSCNDHHAPQLLSMDPKSYQQTRCRCVMLFGTRETSNNQMVSESLKPTRWKTK